MNFDLLSKDQTRQVQIGAWIKSLDGRNADPILQDF
jgi:hypothetical protein